MSVWHKNGLKTVRKFSVSLDCEKVHCFKKCNVTNVAIHTNIKALLLLCCLPGPFVQWEKGPFVNLSFNKIYGEKEVMFHFQCEMPHLLLLSYCPDVAQHKQFTEMGKKGCKSNGLAQWDESLYAAYSYVYHLFPTAYELVHEMTFRSGAYVSNIIYHTNLKIN